ncbi:hypothetical protein ABZP36_035666 [Zizania latifolia]
MASGRPFLVSMAMAMRVAVMHSSTIARVVAMRMAVPVRGRVRMHPDDVHGVLRLPSSIPAFAVPDTRGHGSREPPPLGRWWSTENTGARRGGGGGGGGAGPKELFKVVEAPAPAPEPSKKHKKGTDDTADSSDDSGDATAVKTDATPAVLARWVAATATAVAGLLLMA